MIGTDAFQETPIVEVTRQITKHNYLVMDVRDLPRIVKEVCHCHHYCEPHWCQSLRSLKHCIWAGCQLLLPDDSFTVSLLAHLA